MPASRRRPTPAGSGGAAAARGFPPLAGADARVLILGSMPGLASLRAGEYYAHPQNAFWPIVAALFGFDPRLDYAARCRALVAAGVAVWDVLESCVRPGSLDADIAHATAVPNAFAPFFAAQPGIRHVFFNGGVAAMLYARHVRPVLGPQPAVAFERLPSTSPAHAALDRAAKLAAWRAVARAASAGVRSRRSPSSRRPA